MYDVREVEKNDLFKIVEETMDYILIRNNALQEQYKLSLQDWNGYEHIDSLRVPFKNKYGTSKIQEHKSFIPVYTKKSYEKWLKDNDEELQVAGYIENVFGGDCTIYII